MGRSLGCLRGKKRGGRRSGFASRYGGAIAFDTDGGVYVIDATGGEPVLIATGGSQPSWQP